MRRGANTRRMREYAILPAKNILRNYLKYLRHVKVDISQSYGLTPSQIDYLLFVYDLEFFTLMYVRSHFAAISDNKMRIMYNKPLMNMGLIDVYISRQSVTEEDKQLFGLDNGVGYGARYCLSQKGRLLVQKIYRKLEGLESINAPE
jgi:hypothetical protein